MHQELEWIELIAPDMVDVMSQRFIILRNISWAQPVGRRSLAQTLGMSERVLRTETDFLKKQELISVTKSGMILTAKGQETIYGLTGLMDQLLGLQQMERRLSCGDMCGRNLKPASAKSMIKFRFGSFFLYTALL